MCALGPVSLAADLKLHPQFQVGPLNRRLFGSFVEHLGRCVYTGIYEPDHGTADADGFRTDVAELIRELGPTILRYPGGNFVSCYDWRDGIGPKEQRPARYDLAWRTIESNQVGTDEFLRWCAGLDIEPMLAVNLGTAGVREAVEFLQYVNAKPGIELSDERGRNGHPDPYDVRVWCLGNEMDGPWQTGHKLPDEYGRLAAETGRAMKQFDPSLELIACGSSTRAMPTFGTWERVVLEHSFDQVEHVSAHAYYEPTGGDVDSFLASAEDMDRFISAVVATADHVAAVKQSEKSITISFDEWNVWFAERAQAIDGDDVAKSTYDVTDAVVVGSLLIELMRHTDRVAMACLAQLVNVIAPIQTRPGGPAWRQTIFHPFALTARHAGPVVLSGVQQSPKISTPKYGAVDQLHSVATHNPDTGEVVIFAANRSQHDALRLDVDLADFDPGYAISEHLIIADDDPHARNSESEPDRVVPTEGHSRIDDSAGRPRLRVDLSPISWHYIRLTP